MQVMSRFCPETKLSRTRTRMSSLEVPRTGTAGTGREHGLAMRRIADLYPGRAKTDARDAFIIADAARTLPHTLRPVDVGDDALAELEVLVGFDDDLAGEATRIANRIRGLLTGIHPALERAIGPRITHPAVLEILSRCGGPAGIAKAGRANSPRSRLRTRLA